MYSDSEFKRRAVIAAHRAKAFELKEVWEEDGRADEDARRVLSQTGSTRGSFRNWFREEPEMAFGNFAYHQGVLLLSEGLGWWRLFGFCPNCGEEVWSREFYGLDGLGRELIRFHPEYDMEFQPHEC